MKRIILGMFALTTLAACSHQPQCMGDSDDVYRHRSRDYNWFDGRSDGHGQANERSGLYWNGNKDEAWTK